MQSTERRTCSKCKTEKPLTGFPRRTRNSELRHAKCKECRYSEKRLWREANKEKVSLYDQEWRKLHPDYKNEWVDRHRDSVREKERLRYHANPEKAQEKRRKMYAEHRDNRLAGALKRRQELPWEKPFWQATYKARALNAIPVWADFDAMKAVYRTKHERQQREGICLHVDHIVPLKHKLASGLHCHQNLQIITAEENVRKGNRLMEVAS